MIRWMKILSFYSLSIAILLGGLKFAQAQGLKVLPYAETFPHLIFSDVQDLPTTNQVEAGVRLVIDPKDVKEAIASNAPVGSVKISKEQYQFESRVGASVFVAVTGTGTAVGTAFLVAPNLVLTNKHVVANDQNECRKFSVDLNHKAENVACQKVEYCAKDRDFCFVRMQPMKNGKQIGEEVPVLQMTFQVPFIEELLFLIGNPKGAGIQATSQRGIEIFKDPSGNVELLHCLRVFDGASGSPVLDTSGRVLGIHYERWNFTGQRLICPSDRLTGNAIPVSVILGKLRAENPNLYREVSHYGASDVYESALQ